MWLKGSPRPALEGQQRHRKEPPGCLYTCECVSVQMCPCTMGGGCVHTCACMRARVCTLVYKSSLRCFQCWPLGLSPSPTSCLPESQPPGTVTAWGPGGHFSPSDPHASLAPPPETAILNLHQQEPCSEFSLLNFERLCLPHSADCALHPCVDLPWET